MALVLWLFALSLFVLPFLRSPAAAGPTEGDWGRLQSEIDLDFQEDVAGFEEEFGLRLGEHIAKASEARFALDSEQLRESPLLQLDRLEPGRLAFEAHCIGCHGATGNGAGAAARYLAPRPRNFRRGIFKFTSTDTQERPLRRDLFQTITRGLSGSSMPDFRLLGEPMRWDLVEYVRYLAIRGEFEQLLLDFSWEEEELVDPDEAYEIVMERWNPAGLRAVYPAAPENDPDEASIRRGDELFHDIERANCAACHGATGQGDGPSAKEFKDDWGYPIQPRDLTRGVFRAGAEAADLYRSIETGINGTPMGAFGGSLDAEQIWDLVHYVQSLGGDNR